MNKEYISNISNLQTKIDNVTGRIHSFEFKPFKKWEEFKLIISPSYRIANYWIKEMGLSLDEVSIITPSTKDIMFYIRNAKPYAYLFEETFDYPEKADDVDEEQYIKFCEVTEHYFKLRGKVEYYDKYN